MENKKYLDKVIGSLVRGTNIDYEIRRVIFSHFSFHFSFLLSPTSTFENTLFSPYFPLLPYSPFSKYCKRQFGLTPEEIEYVWKEYKDIMLEKIHQ